MVKDWTSKAQEKDHEIVGIGVSKQFDIRNPDHNGENKDTRGHNSSVITIRSKSDLTTVHGETTQRNPDGLTHAPHQPFTKDFIIE